MTAEQKGQSEPTEISLTPANELLRRDILSGIKYALTNDAVDTVSLTDRTGTRGIGISSLLSNASFNGESYDHSSPPDYPQTPYLTRITFLQPRCDISIIRAKPKQIVPPFQLVVQATTHQLDAQTAQKGLDIDKQPLVTDPDGVSITLLDNIHGSFTDLGLFSVKGAFHRKVRHGWFAPSNKPNENHLATIYGVTFGEVDPLHTHGLNGLEELYLMREILLQGGLDHTAKGHLQTQAQTDPNMTLATNDFKAIRGSLPVFDAVIGQALATPHFRSYVVRQQMDEILRAQGIIPR